MADGQSSLHKPPTEHIIIARNEGKGTLAYTAGHSFTLYYSDTNLGSFTSAQANQELIGTNSPTHWKRCVFESMNALFKLVANNEMIVEQSQAHFKPLRMISVAFVGTPFKQWKVQGNKLH